MSLKKLKDKLAGTKEPRPVNELRQTYQQLAAQAATAQYQVYVNNRALEELNKQMYAVNLEASERQKLDKQVEDSKKEESKQ